MDPGLPAERTLFYDYRNQMVEFDDLGLGVRHLYGYDPFGRRFEKVVDADGASGGPFQTSYYYDRLRVIEEREGGAPSASMAAKSTICGLRS